jgi:hypothetical protein
MVGGTRIIALDSVGQAPAGEEFLLSEELREQETEATERPEVDEAPPLRRREWLWQTAAMTAVAAWTGFFIWAERGQAAALADLGAWPRLIADWLMPVLLIGMMWLLFMRNSRREAMRFGDTARVLSEESARLENRLITVNRELSLAREFIAAQSRDLEALGRIAVERLSQNSDRLQALIVDNGARIDSIGTVSEAALDNMEKLRGQLPVIASSAKDVTNNIGNAGRTAASQLGELVSGFERINSFGQASERQVQNLRGKIDEALSEFAQQCEQLDQLATNRFAALAEHGAAFRGELDGHEAEALAAIRTRTAALADEVAQTRQDLDSQEQESLTSLRARLSALRDEGTAISRSIRDGEARSLESWREAVARVDEELRAAVAAMEGAENEAVQSARVRLNALIEEAAEFEINLAMRNESFAGEIDRRRQQVEAHEQLAVERIAERLAQLDAEVAERRIGHEQQSAALAAQGEAIIARLAEFEEQLSGIAASGSAAEASFAASLDALTGRLAESRSALAGTDRDIAELTDSGVRLLEIIQASKQQSQHDLHDALAASEKRLTGFEGRVIALRDAVVEAGRHGEALSGLMQSSETDLRDRFKEIEDLQAAFGKSNAAHGEVLGGLRQALGEIEEQSTRLAEKAQGELSQAIDKLLASANQAASTINQTGVQTVSALASQLGEESASAIDKAMRASAGEASGQLEQAAAHAAGVSREAAIQLRDQLSKVNELVGNLERRVAHARQRAEEQVDNDFSRRAALITESLNSNAIDIAKALSTDVSDTAWSAYLRGDRGIFTRRAVSLIDNGEAKAITQVFEGDPQFREHVSRYIHDFEAILRQVLSTRDGHALGVTVLSSDLGKLYVALAQSIERLRG